MTSCLLFVYELPAGKDRIVNYRDDDKYKLKMVKPGVSEISTRLKIMAGKSYIVIPAVKRETETGEFFLSLYFNTPLHQIDIRNITDPKNRCKLIYMFQAFRLIHRGGERKTAKGRTAVEERPRQKRNATIHD